MSAKKTAFKISEWKQVSDKAFFYEGEERPAVRIGIGEIDQPDGTKQYVIEPFYEDILPLIDKNAVTVYIDLYAEPMVVLESHGNLIIHNANVKILKEETVEALDEKVVTIGNQLKSLAELRNNIQARNGIGPNTKALREILSDGLNKKVSYNFIRLVLKEMYNPIDAGNELSMKMLGFSNEELVRVKSGLINKELTDGTSIQPTSQLLMDGFSYDDIKEAYEKEVCRRFYDGVIK